MISIRISVPIPIRSRPAEVCRTRDSRDTAISYWPHNNGALLSVSASVSLPLSLSLSLYISLPVSLFTPLALF